jgi:hypothetical protein
LLIETIPSIQAGREFTLMRGVSAGIANAISGKDNNAVAYAIGQLTKQAFPQRYD